MRWPASSTPRPPSRGTPDFAVRLAELRRLSTLGPLSVVLREEPDLRSVLTLLLRYEHSYNEALRMRLDESEEIATIRLWFEFGEPAPRTRHSPWAVPRCTASCVSASGPDWRPLAICFRTGRRRISRRSTGVFGPGLQFEHDFTGIVFYASDLDAANALSDPLMRPYAQQFLDSVVSPRAATPHGPGEGARRVLPARSASAPWTRSPGRSTWTGGPCTATSPTTASRSARSSRSTRARLAERYLANDRYSMTDVAYLLGFAAPSAFSRWFHQQFGVTVRNGVPGIIGECGGNASCATCHVYVRDEFSDRVGEPGDLEEDLLDLGVAERRAGSRLSCQISLADDLDGLTVDVPAQQP